MGGLKGDVDQRVQVVGHRGAAGLALENTLAGFERAILLGVDAVECDVHLSADGQLVVLHDEKVDRTTNRTGRVADLRWAELQGMDAGQGQAPPLLGQLLDLLGRRCHLLCELKADGMEAAAVEAVASRGLQAEVTFISFRLERLAKILKLQKDLRVGALIAAPTSVDIRDAASLGAVYIGVHDRYASEEVFRRIRETGAAAGVWTPNTLEQMRAMIALGATHVTTDRPDILLEYLGREGLPGSGQPVR